MKTQYRILGGVSLALSFALGASSAYAQAAPAAPPPAWKQGMPESMAKSTLAPMPGKLTVTKAADVPIEKILDFSQKYQFCQGSPYRSKRLIGM